MARIFPFAALRFDGRVVALSRALCPPHDVLTPRLERELRREPFNAIHVDLPRFRGKNGYRAAADAWARWMKLGALTRDPSPAIYVCEETFRQAGKTVRRLGFFAALNVRAEKNGILAHERTFSGPQSERLRLLRVLRANTSPIFGLFSDASGRARRALAARRGKKPEARGRLGAVAYRLWRVSDPVFFRSLARAVAPQKILIADGHHRCEAAKRYWAMTRRPEAAGVLAYFCPEEDPGLSVMPTHRVVKGRAWRQASLALCAMTRRPSLKDLLAKLRASKNPYAYGLFDGGFFLAEPKAARGCKSGLGAEWLNRFLLGRVKPDEMGYTPAAAQAVSRARARKASAFLIKPFTAGEIRAAVARAGLLPPKSTYFYPKIPAGLVFKSAA